MLFILSCPYFFVYLIKKNVNKYITILYLPLAMDKSKYDSYYNWFIHKKRLIPFFKIN